MDTSTTQAGAPLAVLLLTCMLLPAQDYAAYAAEHKDDVTAYGGQARHNTGVRPWKNKSDSELKKDVKSELASNSSVGANDIEVSVKNGTVTLKGTVENQRSLDDAIESAREAGAKKVLSKLKMRDDDTANYATYGGQARHNTGARPWRKKSDSVLRDDVRNELASSPMVDADAIEVSVRNGHVTLKGTVENQRSLDDVIESTREAGARTIISKLKVRDEDSMTYGGQTRHNTGDRPWRKKSDPQLRDDVKNELASSPSIDADDIEVSVKNGNVTLKGTVDNQRSLDNAIENAREAGAKTVISKLKMVEEE